MIVILTVAGMTVPLAAHALNEQVWLMVNGGGGTYMMSDLNAEIDAVNAANAGTGWSFPRVERGRSLGLAMGFETASQWNFGVGVDRLDASTKASDASGALEYKFGANNWRLFGEYALQPVGNSTFFVGIGVGMIMESGKLIESASGSAPVEYKIGGSDPSYEGYVGGNVWITPQIAVTATAGYRYARVKEIHVEGVPFIMSNGEVMSLDFTGPSARLGIKLAAKSLGI
jgi:hypothetical protein